MDAAGADAAPFRDEVRDLVVKLPLAVRVHFVHISLFGSVASGTYRPDSDIDIFILTDPQDDADSRRAADHAIAELHFALYDAFERPVGIVAFRRDQFASALAQRIRLLDELEASAVHILGIPLSEALSGQFPARDQARYVA